MNNTNNTNNNNTRDVYNTTAGRANSSGGHTDGEMGILHSPSNGSQLASETMINIENDLAPGTSEQQQLQQIRRGPSLTRINIETDVRNLQRNTEIASSDERQRIRNIFSMFREARHQFNRSQSQSAATTINSGSTLLNTHSRTWRENLYNVFASPVSPRTDVLLAFLTPSSSTTIRYNSLPTNVLPEEHFRNLLDRQTSNPDSESTPSFRSLHSSGLEAQAPLSSALRLSRQNSRLTDERNMNENSTSTPHTAAVDLPTASNSPTGIGGVSSNTSTTSGGRLLQSPPLGTGSTTPTVDIDNADTNDVGEMIVKFVSHFVRYLPFIFILFVKFIHDNLLGILDIMLLHAAMYQINKSLKEQIAKFNQKSYAILYRDVLLVVCIVSYRFILSTTSPDPFGLLINPPEATLTLSLSSTQKSKETNKASDYLINYINQMMNSEQQIDKMSSVTTNPLSDTISVTKTVSLGVLLYYVAVNDLILKLLTQLVKLIVTMLPSKVIRYNSRARLYALIEYISQFYRALVPIRQWLTFLFESYSGLEVISGILFSAFYMGSKGFEFVERGKSVKKALINFIRDMGYDRKPTKDELEAAGTICPICHDSYTNPMVLECGHIFCNECVKTWFKREQTCPMCRAKVSEDPTWQDGALLSFSTI